ncbi:uncharacterized protein LOC103482815 isoform X1 [Cucumis melo]|uniref:Uncharacterized protein LOC103482815 isoform X1 n=1 Tax=Cucumis melo TaxID=3656 RepID=A0ABM3L754_CUCME|nr:uncharacterized protein LOC103482815 isoform X1 [Cucumis melo]
MAYQQCTKPADHAHGQHQQKHDQQHDHHCFGGHVSDKIKGVFVKGHHHDQAHPASGAVHHSANDSHCKGSGSKKKKEHQVKKEGGLLHKIKEAFSDHSSDSSDSENECHKPHHNKKAKMKGEKEGESIEGTVWLPLN